MNSKQDITALLSYHYCKRWELDSYVAQKFGKYPPKIFLDCGAWSAFTQGVGIDIDSYIEFIEKYAHHFSVYSNLDDMGSPEQTYANQRYMEDAGLSPLPVFHTGEPWEVFEKYCRDYDYVAIGKIVPYTQRKKVIMPWIAKCFRIAGDTKIHGFGVTNWEMLKSFGWHSVDSSSWGSGFRYGQIKLFDARRGEFVTLKLGQHANWIANSDLVRSYGFREIDFASRKRNTRSLLATLSALSYYRARDYLNTFKERPLIMYLADTAPKTFKNLTDGLDLVFGIPPAISEVEK